jgi:hypothetical protein
MSNWDDDDELMEDIRRALATADVDESVMSAARGAFAWRTVDADLALAELAYDSRLDDLVAVRGPSDGSIRILHFASGDLAVDIELSPTGIEGQLIPPRPGQVTMLTPDGPAATVTADEIGCFRFPNPPRGPMRLECVLEAGTFVTEWTVV